MQAIFRICQGIKINQAPVVQKLDSTIHWISIRENKLLHYPLDRDLKLTIHLLNILGPGLQVSSQKAHYASVLNLICQSKILYSC